MKTEEMAVAVIQRIVDLVNEAEGAEKGRMIFESDWGEYTLTVYTPDGSHTHMGVPGESSLDQLIEDLYNSLHGGPGLSWQKPQK